jgi:hypothetical protein
MGRHAKERVQQIEAIMKMNGGRGGIRTLDSLATIPVFETGRFNHSRTLPWLM